MGRNDARDNVPVAIAPRSDFKAEPVRFACILDALKPMGIDYPYVFLRCHLLPFFVAQQHKPVPLG